MEEEFFGTIINTEGIFQPQTQLQFHRGVRENQMKNMSLMEEQQQASNYWGKGEGGRDDGVRYGLVPEIQPCLFQMTLGLGGLSPRAFCFFGTF